MTTPSRAAERSPDTASDPRPRVDVVVKVGGALLADAAAFERVVDALDRCAPTLAGRTLLVVPGGGPFADAVRAVDARLMPGDDAAHWMAILAMDQYAELLAACTSRSARVDDPRAARSVCAAGRIPILAPHRWLRAVDPLPHSWDATSDSIAAWIALDTGASELILVKRAAGPTATLTDAHFPALLSRAAATGHPLTVRSCVEDDLVRLVRGIA